RCGAVGHLGMRWWMRWWIRRTRVCIREAEEERMLVRFGRHGRQRSAPVWSRSGRLPDVSASHHPHSLGVRARDGGIDIAVLATAAERVEVCLLDPMPEGGWAERRVDLACQTHGVWHGFVPGVPVGQHYGLRAHGPWEPALGHRYNPAKLLL